MQGTQGPQSRRGNLPASRFVPHPGRTKCPIDPDKPNRPPHQQRSHLSPHSYRSRRQTFTSSRTMAGRKDKTKPRDVANHNDFLESYFRERGIKRTIDSVAISDCVRRAEEARENFKRMRAPEAPELPAPGATGALSDAQKYSRRLLNNRKSAAASRVFDEVLKKEQAHTLETVVNERDTYAAELARAKAEREKVEKEATELRALVKQLQSAKQQNSSGLIDLSVASTSMLCTGSAESQERAEITHSQNQDLKRSPMAPALYARDECSHVKMGITESQEQDIKLLPALDPISSQKQDIEDMEKNTKSLRISFKAGEALNLGMMSSQSSHETEVNSSPDVLHNDDARLKFPGSSQESETRAMRTPIASQDMNILPRRSVRSVVHVDKEASIFTENKDRDKFPVGSSLGIGHLNSQMSQGGMPVNLRFSMASQDVEPVDEVFHRSECQTGIATKGLRPLGI